MPIFSPVGANSGQVRTATGGSGHSSRGLESIHAVLSYKRGKLPKRDMAFTALVWNCVIFPFILCLRFEILSF